MEHFRLSGDWSPPLTAESVTPFFHGESFPPTPIKTEFDDEVNFQYTDRSQISNRRDFSFDSPRLKLSLRRFERPSFVRIASITVLCLLAYPVLYAVTLVAKDLPLFTVRVIVAVWCSGVGFALRYSLLEIGIQHIEAATWATLIHMSYEETGMKLGDLVRSSQNPTSFLSALRILLSRFRSRKTARHSRGSYNVERPWSLGLFIFIAILGPILPFILGRIMDIQTLVRNQRTAYREILIAGDLSQDDIDRATKQQGAFANFIQTWTLLPYGTSTPDYFEFAYGNDTVYFPQPSLSQFVHGGSGLGTFDINGTASVKYGPNSTKLELLRNGNAPNDGIGVVIRYPQWGIRIHCKKLPDPDVNLIPSSNQSFTYAFLPQDLLRGLFAGYGMDLPAELKNPNIKSLDPNDTIPSNIDPSKISYLIKWWQNGVAHSFHTFTIPDTDTSSLQGWTTVETVLIRLNTSLTPSGHFPVHANVSDKDVESRIGYDAAVCVEKYEPWIIEAYNTSVGSPAILRVVEKVHGNTSLPNGKNQGDLISNTRYLNTTGKNNAFYAAHDNGINLMVKDNGRDFFYVPSPTAVSFTDGSGPEGYTKLSAKRFAIIRARFDAANVLPYLAGSGPIVAQSYPDQTLAYVAYARWQLICLLIFLLILGLVGELFVPSLPYNMPRRGFGIYSWLALFQSQGLQFEINDDLNKLSLEELEKMLRDTEVKFIV